MNPYWDLVLKFAVACLIGGAMVVGGFVLGIRAGFKDLEKDGFFDHRKNEEDNDER